MKQKPESLYLDLLKDTLSFSLWPEPPIPVEVFNYRRSPVKKQFVATLSQVLGSRNMYLVKESVISTDDKQYGRTRVTYGDTMIGRKRLDNLQYCIETVLQDGVEGDLIETGVWRGGACIFMRAVLAAYGVEDRKVFVADSFEGLPAPDANNFPADAGDKHHTHNTYLGVSRKEVEENFEKYGLLDDQVIFLEGWFIDTLPQAPIEKLAVLRSDGDMYESTIETLENLYPKLSSGGFCIIDDYALPGCEAAVNDYRSEHGISAELVEIDWTGRYWRKE